MVSHLFIAEKPSVAKEVAAARAAQTGATAQKSGDCWQVGDDRVVWLFGHMYEQVPPHHYDPRYKDWRFDHLPIIPDRWALAPYDDKKDHIRRIVAIARQSKVLVNAGDAAREGQLLVDEVLVENGFDAFGPNVMRLWIQDMVQAKIVAAIEAMAPNAEKRNLYQSAVARQRADWTIGLNGTRAYTIKARDAGANSVISVGRVQTPTLRLVVDRDREIAKFRPVNHFLPTGVFAHANGRFRAKWMFPSDHPGCDPEGRLVDRAAADEVGRRIAGKPGTIQSVETVRKSKAPPLPFDLSALQKECSGKFGLTAEQTLQVAQALYETRKVASYPRSDSQYLPTGILKDEAPRIVESLSGAQGDLGRLAAGANLSLKSPAWNDSKVSDHYGIIPTIGATPNAIAGLNDLERKVFDLIAKRFVAQFYPDQRWNATTILVGCEGETFKATGRVVTDPGWTVVYGAKDEDDEEEDKDGDDQTLPSVTKGDGVLAEKCDVVSKTTTPPPKWTDGTLIEAMKQIHRFVKDSEIKKKLKETSGIGTAATRSNIIETIVKRLFIERKGKYVVSTKLGQSVIDAVDGELSDPTMTALWEDQLQRISDGTLGLDRFMEAIAGKTRQIIEELGAKQIRIAGVDPLPGHGKDCPKCGKGKLVTRMIPSGKHKGKKILACDKRVRDDPNSCDYVDWNDGVKPLPGHGKPCPSCGKGTLVTRSYVPKGERRAKSILVCDAWRKDDPASCRFVEGGGSSVKPLPNDGKPCPTCAKGTLVTRQVREGTHKGKRFLSCSLGKKDDPASCRHFEWEQAAPIKGDGDPCPACGKGRLRTRVSSKPGPNQGKKFLSCDAWSRDNPDSCRHTVFPDDGKERRPVKFAKAG